MSASDYTAPGRPASQRLTASAAREAALGRPAPFCPRAAAGASIGAGPVHGCTEHSLVSTSVGSGCERSVCSALSSVPSQPAPWPGSGLVRERLLWRREEGL